MGMKKYLSAALILALLLSTMALMGCREEAPEVPKVDLLLAEDMLSADPMFAAGLSRYCRWWDWIIKPTKCHTNCQEVSSNVWLLRVR